MAPASVTDEVASPGPLVIKCCPCKMTVRGRSVIWINCKNEDCGLSWHATCAGFSKSIKQNTVGTLGEWMCPRCVMTKSFPDEKAASSGMPIEKITAKLNDIDQLKEDIKNIKTTIQNGFEFLENRVNEKVESYASVVSNNIKSSSENNKLISSIEKSLSCVKENMETKKVNDQETLEKQRKLIIILYLIFQSLKLEIMIKTIKRI